MERQESLLDIDKPKYRSEYKNAELVAGWGRAAQGHLGEESRIVDERRHFNDKKDYSKKLPELQHRKSSTTALQM